MSPKLTKTQEVVTRFALSLRRPPEVDPVDPHQPAAKEG
jgi:hypothetical protein